MKYCFISIIVIFTNLLVETALGQALTKEQAAVEKAKTDSLTKVNYQQILKSLNI